MLDILSQRRKILTADMSDLKKARASQEELLAQITQRLLECQGALAEVAEIEKQVQAESEPTRSAEKMPF